MDAAEGSTAGERIWVDNPSSESLNVDVYVVQFATAGVTEQDVDLHRFVVPTSAAGNLSVTPSSRSMTVGQRATLAATWSGLTPGQVYFGEITYRTNGATAPMSTMVRIRA
jgi:hypothetical protein